MAQKHFVVVFPIRLIVEHQRWQICLPKKKLKIGAGRRNGFGGKINLKEPPREAAAREFGEESKKEIASSELIYFATGWFHNHDAVAWRATVEMYFFITDGQGMYETDEMGPPEWFYFDEVPLYDLMPADIHWLPIALERWRQGIQVPLHIEAHMSAGQQDLLYPVVILDQDNLDQREKLIAMAS